MGEKGDHIQIVKIEGEGVKSVANLLMIMIVAFIMVLPAATWAVLAVLSYEDRVDTKFQLYKQNMDRRMDDLDWRARQDDYWMQRAEVAMTTHGFDVPLPSQRKDKPK